MDEGAARDPTNPPLERISRDLHAVLTSREKLQAWAMQRRLFALTHRRIVLGATTGRFIALTRPLLGGFALTDVRWQDLKSVEIRVGVLAATLVLTAYASPDLASASGPTRTLVYTGLEKQPTEALYRICQANEQAWREKRRIRDLEEMRARAGGLQIGGLGAAMGTATGSAALADAGSVPTVSGSEAAAGSPAVARLQHAKSLLDQGLITDAEYESLKARIIAQI